MGMSLKLWITPSTPSVDIPLDSASHVKDAAELHRPKGALGEIVPQVVQSP